ncbi:hypothetical protein E2C01_077031 [Portunus trituberculatus]|uniref:Uncharacterized protein n=1 Tax=Portunus trituberculatus TaxID=210409 RepID=A0A5B7IKB5_PORTR|nr:hypothetical protein [Portunus trituberculatus]
MVTHLPGRFQRPTTANNVINEIPERNQSQSPALRTYHGSEDTQRHLASHNCNSCPPAEPPSAALSVLPASIVTASTVSLN